MKTYRYYVDCRLKGAGKLKGDTLPAHRAPGNGNTLRVLDTETGKPQWYWGTKGEWVAMTTPDLAGKIADTVSAAVKGAVIATNNLG